MQGPVPLLELLAHFQQAVHQLVSLVDESLGYFVLWQMHVLISNIMIEFVFRLVLEHLREKLCRRNVSVELFALWLDGRTLVLKDHRAAPLAVFELHVISRESLAVDERCSQIIGLIQILAIRIEGRIRVSLFAICRQALLRRLVGVGIVLSCQYLVQSLVFLATRVHGVPHGIGARCFGEIFVWRPLESQSAA